MYHHSITTQPLSHVIWMSLLASAVLCAAVESQVPSCSDRQTCLGERPLLPSGCCPLGAWEPCLPSRDQSCDQELGLSCRNEDGQIVTDIEGKCKGKYRLRVTSHGEDMLDLEWSHFAPEDYRFEYVVMLRTGSYNADISTWSLKEVGTDNWCSIHRLKPSTVYFIRVAIWENARASILGNMTETIMAQTGPVEFCIYGDDYHLVGEEMTIDCEDTCVCLPTGEFQCTPQCPESGLPEVEEGCHVVSGEDCCDHRVSCPVGGEPCQMDGTSYPHGTKFDKDCQQCSCQHGRVECELPVECDDSRPSLKCANPVMEEVDDQCCPVWTCGDEVGETCVYEAETYSYLEYFSSQHCGLCQCRGAEGVRCAPDCPPVVMVQPDSACPDPHIRQDGCCDTLHCHDPTLSLAQFLGRVFAQSYSPVTLTISFEVNPLDEVNQFPLYCTYEILFANSTDPQVTWHRRVVQPIDVRLRKDQAHNTAHSTAHVNRPRPTLGPPIDALTTDNAIVVGDRAYVTLAGMHPGTTYYVKIQRVEEPSQVTHQDMMDAGGSVTSAPGGGHSTAMVVVKTMSLANETSCFFNGTIFPHGHTVKDTCDETCVCHYSDLSCSNNCEAQLFVMARSSSCPQPRLVKQDGQCCPEWKCFPAESGCLHNGMILSDKHTGVEGCNVCSCENGTVSCSLRCPSTVPLSRPGCSLVNITGVCCPQWKCPVESHPPIKAKSSILIYLSTSCSTLGGTFTKSLEDQLMTQVKTACHQSINRDTDRCKKIQIKVFCPKLNHKRQKREVKETDALGGGQGKLAGANFQLEITLEAKLSLESPHDLTVERLLSESLQLAAALNRSLQLELPSGDTLTSVGIARVPRVTYVCGAGFSLNEGSCVLTEIETNVTRRAITSITTEPTATTVLVTWDKLDTTTVSHITHLAVEYRRVGDIKWVSSGDILPTKTSHLLQHLMPDQNYTLRLKAKSVWSGEKSWTMSEVTFRTLRTGNENTNIQVTNIDLFFDGVQITWEQSREKTAAAVEILFKSIYSQQFSKRLFNENLHTKTVRLTGLTTDTPYTAQVIIRLNSGEEGHSEFIYFVTKSNERGISVLILVACVSCLTGFIVSGLVVAAIYMWRRRRLISSSGTSFVNKTFEIMDNNSKDTSSAE